MRLHELHTSNYNTKILLSNNLLKIQIHYDCLTLLYLIYTYIYIYILKYKNII